MMHNPPFLPPLFASERLWRLSVKTRSPVLSWHLFLSGVFLILLLVAGGFLYIRQITSTATSGYDVSALERRAEGLRAEEAKLRFESAELESLERIEERLPTLNLIPADNVAYTSPLLGGSVTGQIPVGTIRP